MRELLGEIGEPLRFIDDRLRKYDLAPPGCADRHGSKTGSDPGTPAEISVGRPYSRITQRSSPATSSSSLVPPFESSMCCWSWNMLHAESFTSTSLPIRLRAWTLQQLRGAVASDHTYRFVLHDRDANFLDSLPVPVWADRCLRSVELVPQNGIQRGVHSVPREMLN
jgi:hypothetical protein